MGKMSEPWAITISPPKIAGLVVRKLQGRGTVLKKALQLQYQSCACLGWVVEVAGGGIRYRISLRHECPLDQVLWIFSTRV